MSDEKPITLVDRDNDESGFLKPVILDGLNKIGSAATRATE